MLEVSCRVFYKCELTLLDMQAPTLAAPSGTYLGISCLCVAPNLGHVR